MVFKFRATYDILALELNKCLEEARIDKWMSKRKIILIKKDTPQKKTKKNKNESTLDTIEV